MAVSTWFWRICLISGTTNCKWDVCIPLEPLWEQYRRIIKNNGAIILFGSEPFSSRLRISNIEWFKYDWIWEKTMATGFMHCKNAPMKKHEIISVFSPGSVNHESCTKNRMVYYPQFQSGKPYVRKRTARYGGILHAKSDAMDRVDGTINKNSGYRYPTSVIKFSNSNANRYHTTEKPVALLEYLIRTYTNEDETVLDNTMGSGSTGVAAVNTGRNFIGMELDPGYFETARNRIAEAEEAEKWHREKEKLKGQN